jgi:hypothetical protein
MFRPSPVYPNAPGLVRTRDRSPTLPELGWELSLSVGALALSHAGVFIGLLERITPTSPATRSSNLHFSDPTYRVLPGDIAGAGGLLHSFPLPPPWSSRPCFRGIFQSTRAHNTGALGSTLGMEGSCVEEARGEVHVPPDGTSLRKVRPCRRLPGERRV